MTTDPPRDPPTDRALHALAPLYTGCSNYLNGAHLPPCPAVDGRDHNLPDTDSKEPARA